MPKRRNPAEAWPSASTRRTLGRSLSAPRGPGQTKESGSTCRVTWEPKPFISTKNVQRKPYAPNGRGDGIHAFHPTWSPLNPRGTKLWCPHRFPDSSATGEDNTRKEWKVLVTFSVTESLWSTAEPKARLSLWRDCTLNPLSPKDEEGGPTPFVEGGLEGGAWRRGLRGCLRGHEGCPPSPCTPPLPLKGGSP